MRRLIQQTGGKMFRLILPLMLLAALLGCGGDSPEKYMQAGFVNFQQQKYDEAIANYEKAIKLRAPGRGRL